MSDEETSDNTPPSILDAPFTEMFKSVWDTLGAGEESTEDPQTPEADSGTPAVPGSPAPQSEGTQPSLPASEPDSVGSPAEPGVLDESSTPPEPVVAPPPPANSIDWGSVSTGLEETLVRSHQEEALAEVREEHKAYFDALDTHSRLLVGTEVPSLRGEGTETLRDSQDAEEWKDAVKSILVADINARVQERMSNKNSPIQPLHDAVAMFRDNPDLVPSYSTFNRKLADQFAAAVKPYEHRVDGKLMGYSIPVQPIIDVLRQQLAAAPAPAAPAAPPVATPPAKPADPPQEGIPASSASGGTGDSGDDFQESYWAALGMDGFRV